MAAFRDSDPYQVIWLTRRLFRALARRSDEILEDLEISAAERAVLEFLCPGEARTVPDLAERYGVSRQHVQVTVNALLDKGLLESKPNPRHKRSRLIRPTAEGRRLFATVLRRDRKAIERLFSDLPADRVAVTRDTLASLLRSLEGETS